MKINSFDILSKNNKHSVTREDIDSNVQSSLQIKLSIACDYSKYLDIV
jgi:hypothetical protein